MSHDSKYGRIIKKCITCLRRVIGPDDLLSNETTTDSCINNSSAKINATRLERKHLIISVRKFLACSTLH